MLDNQTKKDLITLAEHLYTVPRKTFNLNTWWCGTAGCAIGHACTIPKFIKRGFSLHNEDEYYGSELSPISNYGNSGWQAVADFFNLSLKESRYLFSVDEYPVRKGPKTVARRILTFIKNDGQYTNV